MASMIGVRFCLRCSTRLPWVDVKQGAAVCRPCMKEING